MPDQPPGEKPTEADLDDWFDYAHREEEATPGPHRRIDALAIVAAILAVITIIGIVLLWPDGSQQDRYRESLLEVGLPTGTASATVTAVDVFPCEFEPSVGCVTVDFLITDGPDRGRSFVQEFGISTNTPEFAAGDRVVLGVQGDTPFEFRYQYRDRERKSVLLIVAIAFAVVVIVLGRWRGLAALAGLGASIAVLMAFVLPAILDGRDPVLVAVFGAAAIAFTALYLAHGFNRMTTVALLGMLGALLLTALLSSLVLSAAEVTGFATEESVLLSLFEGIDIRGLVLAGTVLGAAGALDDVTVTQASAVWELRATDPTMGPRRLFTSGLRIGQDHIASTVNTLLLAYAGAALPLLVLFVLANQPLATVAGSEVVAIEIFRTLVGSIGLVAAVPFTTWLAARTAPKAGGKRLHGH